MLINFTLAPIAEIVPWGEPGSYRLHWFGLTYGEFWIQAGEAALFEYSEHALSHSADAEAICYIQLNVDGERVCGVGRSHDIVQASLDGILGAMNRAAPGRERDAAA